MTEARSKVPAGALRAAPSADAASKRPGNDGNGRDPSQIEFLRKRVEQLERALDSRIVIEQAKGILGERFALGLDHAFDVLRDAARSTRANIHDVARAVVINRETPDTVLRALARNREASKASDFGAADRCSMGPPGFEPGTNGL